MASKRTGLKAAKVQFYFMRSLTSMQQTMLEKPSLVMRISYRLDVSIVPQNHENPLLLNQELRFCRVRSPPYPNAVL